jgi:magnesium chelatase subunit D
MGRFYPVIYFPEGSGTMQRQVLSNLQILLSKHMAVRIGETAVVSTKVHMQGVKRPHRVTAIVDADAGEVFYHRQNPNEVVHIDIFHSEGRVSPKEVSLSIRGAFSGLRLETQAKAPGPNIGPFIPYIDLQTALGGGRLDGPLTSGQEESVRTAHLTHVHLAMLNISELISGILTLVASVESAIERSGLELRKVREIKMARKTAPVNLKDYQTSSDSLLQQQAGNPEHESISWYRKEALARQAAKGAGSVNDALKLLEALAKGMRPGELSRFTGSRDKSGNEIRQALYASSLLHFDGQRYRLTGQGRLALQHLRQHSAEIEAYLRRLLWSLPAQSMPKAERPGVKLRPAIARSRGYALPKAAGDQIGHLAIAETIMAKCIRTLQSRGPLAPADLRFWYIREKKSRPIILLLDASASMSGKRIASAKELARHLIVTNKEKLCVVVFQDSDVEVVCDFTKSPQRLEEGLARIQAQGLTPLATGLEKAGVLCRKSVLKPLVLCVTDGIPTVPHKTLSPIDDAIDAAKNLTRQGVNLGCIGLEPNRSFLREMMQEAKGALYIVEELEVSKMAAIARREQNE